MRRLGLSLFPIRTHIKRINCVKYQYSTTTDALPSALLRQVREYQLKHPHQLLLTRVGDFYEAYFSQADTLGRALSLAVVDKKFKNLQEPVRFTGIPSKSLDKHLPTLVKENGYHVAINEQFQDPVTKKFSRKVIRIVTPGTLIVDDEDTNVAVPSSTSNNFILSISSSECHSSNPTTKYGLAWADVNTGEFYMKDVDFKDLSSEISSIRPVEIIVDPRIIMEMSIAENLENYSKVIIDNQHLPKELFLNDINDSIKEFQAFCNSTMLKQEETNLSPNEKIVGR